MISLSLSVPLSWLRLFSHVVQHRYIDLTLTFGQTASKAPVIGLTDAANALSTSVLNKTGFAI